jgi:cobalt-zinc-cadmium efflux system outer membrane protein
MKQIIIIISALIGMAMIPARAADSEEMLQQYLIVAAENNPGLKQRFNEYMASLEVISQTSALPDPQLAFGYFISPVETRVGPQRFRISATQMFPWFGTLNARGDAAESAARAKYEAFEEAKSGLFNEVRATYYNLYFNRKAIQIVDENISILNTFNSLALIKVETGTVSALDQYRIEMELGDLENRLALLKDEQSVLNVRFFNLLNTSRETVELPDTLWNLDPEYSREALLDSVLNRNHRLLGLEMQKDALVHREEAAKKTGLPQISVGIDYTIVGKGENDLPGQDAFMFPKIGITIPLYREKYRAMVREASILQSAKEFEKDDQANMLETLFENTWKEYLDANRRLGLYSTQVGLANQSIRLLETEYTTASKDFEEILRMERRMLFYSLELEKARTDKQAAVSFISYLTGN